MVDKLDAHSVFSLSVPGTSPLVYGCDNRNSDGGRAATTEIELSVKSFAGALLQPIPELSAQARFA